MISQKTAMYARNTMKIYETGEIIAPVSLRCMTVYCGIVHEAGNCLCYHYAKQF